jgi:hypothetical protein
MNAAHWHLVLNHIPLIGIGFVALLMVIAFLRKSSELVSVSMVLAVIVALFAIPAYLTGEPAEEVVENTPGISENLIEEHEEAAEKAFILVEAVGGLALIGLIARRFSRNLGNTLAVATLAGLLAGGGLVAYTANLGGKIHHQEIRDGSVTLAPSAGITGEDRD